jgi:hypothetical protein
MNANLPLKKSSDRMKVKKLPGDKLKTAPEK